MQTLIVTFCVVLVAVAVGLMADPPLPPGHLVRVSLSIIAGGVLAAILTEILERK